MIFIVEVIADECMPSCTHGHACTHTMHVGNYKLQREVVRL